MEENAFFFGIAGEEVACVVEEYGLAVDGPDLRELQLFVESRYRDLPGCEGIGTDSEDRERRSLLIDGATPFLQCRACGDLNLSIKSGYELQIVSAELRDSAGIARDY